MDLSHNCLGRTYILAKVLQRKYEVEIIGPLFGDGIWAPVRNDDTIPIKCAPIKGVLKPFVQLSSFAEMADGDVLYANKPVLSSFGVGLLSRIRTGRPLVVDIDDWQCGLGLPPARDIRMQMRHLLLYNHYSYWNAVFSEKLLRFSNSVTVSNSFLHARYGGSVVPHGRDTSFMDPERYDRVALRRSYDISDRIRLVLFCGTVRKHKGLEDLINAVYHLKQRETKLMVAGLDENRPFCRDILAFGRKLLGDRFLAAGEWQIQQTPEFLAISDAVVIPQEDHPFARAQTPAKVFDAMAMGKPIIATELSDLPDILEGCGRVIPPGDPNRLAETIDSVLNDTKASSSMGRRARQRCIERYSWDVMEETLSRVFSTYE